MSSLLGKIKEAMRHFNQANSDDMGKLSGYFFNKGKNELFKAIAEEEEELLKVLSDVRDE